MLKKSTAFPKGEIKFLLLVFSISFVISALTPIIPRRAYVLGASEVEVGMLGFLISLAYTVFPFSFGIIVTRIGKVKLILSALIGYVILILFYSIVAEVWHILLLRFLEGVVIAAIWPTLDSLTQDVFKRVSSKRSLSLFSTSWSLGYTVGPLVFGQITDVYGFNTALGLPFMITLISIVFCLSLEHEEEEVESVKFREVISLLSSRQYLINVTLPVFMLGYDIGTLFNIFPVYATSLKVSSSTIGGLLSAFMGIRVVFFSMISTPRSYRGLVVWESAGLLLLGLSFILISRVAEVSLWYFVFCIIGIAASLLYLASLSSALMVSNRVRSSSAGAFETSWGLGSTIGSLTGGFIAYLTSFVQTFVVSGIVSIISSITVLLYFLRVRDWRRS